MVAQMNVRSGLCQGGPRDGQSLATMKDGPVRHPADPNGFYVYVKAVGPTPALWRWVKTNTKVRTPND